MSTGNSQPQSVDHAIREYRRREKPRFTVIVPARRERQSIESGTPLRQSEHLLSDALAEIRRERHALATVAHGVKDAVVLSHMRQAIKCVGNPSHPRVSHADGFQLRKYSSHHLLQTRHACQRILLSQRCPSTEYDALAVSRRPEVHDDSPRIDDVATVGYQRTNSFGPQGLGGDLIAADRDDPSLMPWRQCARVSVGREQYLARMNDSARGQQLETSARSLERV